MTIKAKPKTKAAPDRSMITFIVPNSELTILKEYCSTFDVSQTSVLREAIRSLEPKLKELERAS